MVTGTLDLGKRITFPDGEEEEMPDREDEIEMQEMAEVARRKPEERVRKSLLQDQADAQRGVLARPPFHDRYHFLALGFMSYVTKNEEKPSDVEMLADLLRQEALR